MVIDLSNIITHDSAQEVLFSIIAFLLRSAVNYLKKIYKIFHKLEQRTEKIESNSEVIIAQNEKILEHQADFRYPNERKRYPNRRYYNNKPSVHN